MKNKKENITDGSKYMSTRVLLSFVFQVYRRGLHAIPLSVDLWLHYLTFIKENSDPNDPETEGRIRA